MRILTLPTLNLRPGMNAVALLHIYSKIFSFLTGFLHALHLYRVGLRCVTKHVAIVLQVCCKWNSETWNSKLKVKLKTHNSETQNSKWNSKLITLKLKTWNLKLKVKLKLEVKLKTQNSKWNSKLKTQNSKLKT